MEKLFGPVDGYYGAIFVRELGGKFRVSYKVCAAAPTDYRSARPVRHKRVDGLSDSPAEAFDIAEQLARLHIAGLSNPVEEAQAPAYSDTVPAEFESSLGDHAPRTNTGRMYAATEPCPLYPLAGN
jgi:hypothetical protein